MWTTRILILGLVRWLQPVHGYEVLRELMSWGVEDWLRVKRGSIYHALKRLAADGLLEVVSTEQVDNRPARTSYRMTPRGEQEFQTRLRDMLWTTDADREPFWVAWSFVPVLSIRETAAMLRNRATVLRGHRDRITRLLAEAGDNPGQENFLPRHVRASQGLKRDELTLEIRWCEETAVEAESGQLYGEIADALAQADSRHWRDHINNRLDDRGRLREP